MTAAAAPADPPELTNRRIFAIAAPIVISNATVPILGAVDTGVVGQLGQAAPIGAVGVGAAVIAFAYWMFGFLRMGTTGLAAQAAGAGDRAEAGAVLLRGLLIAGAAGLVYIAAQGLLFRAAFELAPASAEVEALTRDYLAWRIWGAPAAIAVYAVNGWLIALERTRAVLAVQIWMNGLNILLDLWFVLGLGWGVAGVGGATVIAEWSGLALGLWLCRDAFAAGAWRDRARIFDRARLVHMASVNGDILIRSALLQFSFTFFLFQAARTGDVSLAATQILIQFVHVTAYALDGFAFAAEALVGQAFGARRPGAVRRAARMASWWGLGCVLALGAGFWFAGPALIDLMTTAEAVRAEGRTLLVWVALAPIVGLASWMLDGIFIGATRTRDMRNGMAISVVLFLIAWAVLTPAFGAHGLWAALMVLFAARGVTLGLRYPALERAAGAPPAAGAGRMAAGS